MLFNLTQLNISASQIWDLADGKTNTMELAEAIDNSDLEAFGFTDDFIFELWGAITDAKSGRGKPVNNNIQYTYNILIPSSNLTKPFLLLFLFFLVFFT